jgi:type I restriction enzyme S subunit
VLFVKYLIDYVKLRIQSISQGTTQDNLSVEKLLSIRFDVPDFENQRQIATILSTYDDLIENNTRRIAILEDMAQAIYREWFVYFRCPGHENMPVVDSGLGPIPEGWRWVELRELAEEIRRSVDPSTLDSDTPYFGLEHLPEHSIAIASWGKASDAGSRKYRFESGEILFGKIRPYFHKVGIPPVAGICSTDAIVIRPRTPQQAALVLAVVSSDRVVQQAVQTSQGTKMPRANWAVMERYLVALPNDDALLARFADHMSTTVSLLHDLVMTNRNLRATRDLLVPRLISGEVDVSSLDIDVGNAAA